MTCSDCKYATKFGVKLYCYHRYHAPRVKPDNTCPEWEDKNKADIKSTSDCHRSENGQD